jgi:UDP-N-acetylmuramoyl-tripeptide--D-alanyl-D-alanine ligase
MCLKLPGIYNFYDAQAAILLALELGLNAQQIKAGIESVTPLFGRSQIIRGKYTIIQDCYNANPDSMEKSIEFFSSVTCSGKKILLLGDMFELGTSSLTSHAQICRIAIRSSAYKIFFVGQEFYKLNTEFSKEKNIRFIKTLDENSIKDLVLELKSILSENDILLCKASRSMGLERIVCALGENNE